MEQSIQETPTKLYKYFYEPKANIIVKENIRWGATQTINNSTLNERYDYKATKDKGTYRIISIGDSFTYGLHCNTEENWSEQLEDLLNIKCKQNKFNKFEVINLGVSGYDPSYVVERMKRRGLKYDPDLLLWLFFDPPRNTELIHSLITQSRKLFVNNDDAWRYGYEKSLLSQDVMMVYTLQTNALKHMREVYNNRMTMLLLKDGENNIKFKYLFDFANKDARTKVFEVTNTISDIKFHFSNDVHPNPNGHRVIAEDIYKYLTTVENLNCIK